jgi:hypothetical protein
MTVPWPESISRGSTARPSPGSTTSSGAGCRAAGSKGASVSYAIQSASTSGRVTSRSTSIPAAGPTGRRGDKGGDPVSLAAFLFDLNQAAAARRLAEMLGISADG